MGKKINGLQWYKKVYKFLASQKSYLIITQSDEQITALSDINLTGCISYPGQGQELINLYNDLKKLKG